MKKLVTAPQILEHYTSHYFANISVMGDDVLKAMRHYARIKSDKTYEEGYQSALKQLK